MTKPARIARAKSDCAQWTLERMSEYIAAGLQSKLGLDEIDPVLADGEYRAVAALKASALMETYPNASYEAMRKIMVTTVNNYVRDRFKLKRNRDLAVPQFSLEGSTLSVSASVGQTHEEIDPIIVTIDQGTGKITMHHEGGKVTIPATCLFVDGVRVW